MRKKWDWPLFAQILGVGSISILILYSINHKLALSQLIYWIIGLCILYVVSQFRASSWQGTAKFIYVATLVSLVILHFIGNPVRGSVRWIDLGFFRIQPSEIAKASTILLLANFYMERSAGKISNVLTSLLLVLPPAALVLTQPDLGNALSILGIWLGMTLVSGFKLKHFIVFLISGLIFALLFYELLAPYQKDRLTTFIDPSRDPLGTGYNIIQAKIAIGSGKLTGRGFGRGSQSQLNFLPEAESDFMFASISEQLGMVGATILILLYTAAVARIVAITRDKNRYSQLIVAGVVSFLVIQFLVNVGMNLGLMPVTGITFPFVSYGGSSLLVSLFLVGLVYAVKVHDN